MSTVYVIHAKDDAAFVEKELLRYLPCNGYGRWLGSQHVVGTRADKKALARAMDECQAVLAVLSPAIGGSPTAGAELEAAVAARPPVIVVQCGELKDPTDIPKPLWAKPRIDFVQEEKEAKGEAARLLVGLLPPSDGDPNPPTDAQPISWNEEIFSAALENVTKRHDHARAEFLVAAFAGHLANRPYAYPQQRADADLYHLRQEREFDLMRRYAEPVLASGTRGLRVETLFAQALIETRDYEYALKILQSVISNPASSPKQIVEAKGLVGRTFKQRYVDAPKQPGAAALLKEAIGAYESVYNKDQRQFWHGVNAASCIQRAERDGIAAAPPGRAEEIAQHIAKELELQAKAGMLPVWDCASRVEALLALRRYDDATQAVQTYIHHPGMTAFEVYSTFRQFDQVLQLGADTRGRPILDRLRETVERYRAAGSATRTADASALSGEAISDTPRTRPLLIRVGDAAWDAKGVPDLAIQKRLGQIVTARGSDATVRELLSDPMVISVEDSRPVEGLECDRSIPFIKIAAEYSSPVGNYKEKGDRALVAIIDNGIDVLHGAFLDGNGKSRIVGIWDQTASGGKPPSGFTYGRFFDEAAIAGYVKTRKLPAGLKRNCNGHGTHVASIAAGRAVGGFAGGVAPEAKLLIVVSGGSGPIGYSQSHVEALAFIDEFAAKSKMPVVVNVSQGMNAGAHDGKSALEVAFDAFSDSGRKPGRVVVKSAGNERSKGGHAKLTLPPDSQEELKWNRTGGAGEGERIELWWSSADEMAFRLSDPSGNWSGWVDTSAPEIKGTFPQSGGPFRLVFTKRHIDNGDSMLLIEIGNSKSAAALGEWVLEIRSRAVPEGGELHAWIERSSGYPTSFLNHQSEEMTLSIPGTASSVIAVGAVDASSPIRVGAFSSYGPTRDGQKKPLVCAPGVNVHAADGGTEEGVRADSGTSMAAPHVAGAIALLLSRTSKSGRIPGGNQIVSALRQKTQNYNGRWDRGQGFGVVDVSALLAAF
jgi:subtilisin family serine protease